MGSQRVPREGRRDLHSLQQRPVDQSGQEPIVITTHIDQHM